jgi:hypothetical protein
VSRCFQLLWGGPDDRWGAVLSLREDGDYPGLGERLRQMNNWETILKT